MFDGKNLQLTYFISFILSIYEFKNEFLCYVFPMEILVQHFILELKLFYVLNKMWCMRFQIF